MLSGCLELVQLIYAVVLWYRSLSREEQARFISDAQAVFTTEAKASTPEQRYASAAAIQELISRPL